MIDTTLLRKHLDKNYLRYQYCLFELTGLYQEYGLLIEIDRKNFIYDFRELEDFAKRLTESLLLIDINPNKKTYESIISIIKFFNYTHLSPRSQEYLTRYGLNLPND